MITLILFVIGLTYCLQANAEINEGGNDRG